MLHLIKGDGHSHKGQNILEARRSHALLERGLPGMAASLDLELGFQSLGSIFIVTINDPTSHGRIHQPGIMELKEESLPVSFLDYTKPVAV